MTTYTTDSRASMEMSDDDRDIDIESDVENDSDGRGSNKVIGGNYYSQGSYAVPLQAEKRAHHNALERKRRDHIKDSFTSLRDAVPALQGEKVASRAQILKKAAEYIQFMRRKNNSHQQDIDDLKRQNNMLESQIRMLERAKATGQYMDAHSLSLGVKSERDTDETSSDGDSSGARRVRALDIASISVNS